jgi:hypothetical protein
MIPVVLPMIPPVSNSSTQQGGPVLGRNGRVSERSMFPERVAGGTEEQFSQRA